MKRQRWIWFAGTLGGALAWLIHLMVSYSLGEAACILEGSWFHFLGMSSAGWGLLSLTVFCGLVSIAAMVISFKSEPSNQNSQEFLKKFGLLTNFLFLLAILAQAGPVFMLLGDC